MQTTKFKIRAAKFEMVTVSLTSPQVNKHQNVDKMRGGRALAKIARHNCWRIKSNKESNLNAPNDRRPHAVGLNYERQYD
jgi:hypothetical protein